MSNPTITLDQLEKLNACKEGIDWFVSCGETALDAICVKLVDGSHSNWANWLLTKLMTNEQRIKYAIFAAEQVLHTFETKYPADERPRAAIDAAKLALAAPSGSTENAATAYAAAAAAAAYAAAYAAAAAAADAAAAAAYAAAAADAAADAAAAAAYAAYAAAYAAAAAAADAAAAAAYAAADADAAADAAAAARKDLQIKIVNFGLSLLEEK